MRSTTANVVALACVLYARYHETGAQPFTADVATATDNAGTGGSAPFAPNAAASMTGGTGLERQELFAVTTLPRTCGCPAGMSDTPALVCTCAIPWHSLHAYVDCR